ncbi:hypothetical protein EXT46_14825 [Pseudoalteromonas sp. CO325X]|uniref:DsbA family protein n=1 Tax=Pseudoalteromonas sp. CO325X TaxID=1777262 RepID=UPI0010239A5F|nr:thioredoxin domain-containing protein [Pseudoalteromonas sp. CO325X]RZF79163.1 hypothetical protein EXT46_14825 [Pseudoalteromonas sp. CO325X]
MKRLALAVAATLALPFSVQANDGQRIAQLEQQVSMLINRVSQLQKNQTVIAKEIGLLEGERITTDEAVPLQGAVLEGSESAKIAIMEFTDIQCPYCKKFSLETYPKLKKDFIDTDKVIFANRQNPLSIHEQATEASAHLICANQQGKFAQVKEALFTESDLVKQEKWQEIGAIKSLDQDSLSACLDNEKIYQQIALDKKLAKALGITKTPTFVIGLHNKGKLESWKKLEGAPKYEDLREIIDRLIEKN